MCPRQFGASQPPCLSGDVSLGWKSLLRRAFQLPQRSLLLFYSSHLEKSQPRAAQGAPGNNNEAFTCPMGKVGSKEKVAPINPAAILVISYIQNAVIKTLGFSN